MGYVRGKNMERDNWWDCWCDMMELIGFLAKVKIWREIIDGLDWGKWRSVGIAISQHFPFSHASQTRKKGARFFFFFFLPKIHARLASKHLRIGMIIAGRGKVCFYLLMINSWYLSLLILLTLWLIILMPINFILLQEWITQDRLGPLNPCSLVWIGTLYCISWF